MKNGKPSSDRRYYIVNNLLFWGKLLGASSALAGLIDLMLISDTGFTTTRLVILIVCAITVAMTIWIEKNEDKIQKRFTKPREDVTSNRVNCAPTSHQNAPCEAPVQPSPKPEPVKPAPPQPTHVSQPAKSTPPQPEPTPQPTTPMVPERSQDRPQPSADAKAKWRIPWSSGALREIGLAYEKAEGNAAIAAGLSALETQALAEARENCVSVHIPGNTFSAAQMKALSTAQYNQLSAAQKEALIALLGLKGIERVNTDIPNRQIVVVFSPMFQSVMACTLFRLLNALENMDGALNEMAQGKFTLALQAPLGGKKGLMRWEMLIIQLYPWLKIQETSTNTISASPSDQMPAPSIEPRKAPISEMTNTGKEKALQTLRDKIIVEIDQQINQQGIGQNTKYYTLLTLSEDTIKKTELVSSMAFYAEYRMDLTTHKLSVYATTYPNQFGAYRDWSDEISAERFHSIVTEYFPNRTDLYCLEKACDVEQLFDERMNAAVEKVHAVLKKKEEETHQKHRLQSAPRIPNGTPKMDIERINLKLFQAFGKQYIELIQKNETYLLKYDAFYSSESNDTHHQRNLSSAEAAWVESRLENTLSNPDKSTWVSVMGIDTMSFSYRMNGQPGYSYDGKPARKYTDLMYDLEKLAQYGSIMKG